MCGPLSCSVTRRVEYKDPDRKNNTWELQTTISKTRKVVPESARKNKKFGAKFLSHHFLLPDYEFVSWRGDTAPLNYASAFIHAGN